jgi:hypothetical protein
MPEQKTKPTAVSVESFIEQLPDEQVRDDCYSLIEIMKKTTGADPKMWGPSIIGFGSYHYKYESGHEGDACLTGFSPRKQNITLYVMPGASDHSSLLSKLGKFKAGKGCLYIKRLADVDQTILKNLVTHSVAHLRKKYK